MPICVPEFIILTLLQQMQAEWNWLDNLVFLLGGAVVLVSFPYIAYVLISIVQSETLAIAVVVGVLGYIIGAANYLLLTCEDFKLAGYDQPINCWSG